MSKALNLSSKLGFCGMPIRVDTESSCSHNCAYCFAHSAVIRKRKNYYKTKEGQLSKEIKGAKGALKELLDKKIPLHWGGLSDPFHSKSTGELSIKLQTDIPNYPILYSTKGLNFDENKLNKETRAFQFSICMNDDYAKKLEPNAPLPSQRIERAKRMLKKGFWVGVRIQPYIPIISDSVIDMINSVDWKYVVIEGLKITPQLPYDIRDKLMNLFGLKNEDFFNFGLLNLKPEIRAKCYLSLFNKLRKDYLIGMADNDFHFMSDSKVCCGTDTIPNWNYYDSTTTALSIEKEKIRLSDILNKWLPKGNINSLFTSNRTTKEENTLFGFKKNNEVKDYFEKRFYADKSKFKSSFSPSIFHGFYRVGQDYINPFWGKNRREILEKIANQ